VIVKYLAGYTDPFLSPVTGQLSAASSLPDLELGYVWMGNKQNKATPTFKLIDLAIDVKFLQQQVETIESATVVVNTPQEAFPNAQVLNALDDGLMKNVGGMIEIAQPDVDYLTPELPWGKILIGDFFNRATPQLTIARDNLPNLTYNRVWIGDSTNRPIETSLNIAPDSASYILKTSNSSLPSAQALDMLVGTPPRILKAAYDGTIEVAIPDQDYATTATLEEIKAQTEEYKNQAAQSAEEAATSAEEAATSAEEAALSAEEAALYAEEAALSAEEASLSATEASISAAEATAAAAEATAAAAEATAAAAESTTAAAEASGAAVVATSAALTAEIAALTANNNANDAEASATSASNSASAASASATSASESATSAANSATLAQNSLNTFLTTGISLQGAVYGSGSPSLPITTYFQQNPILPGAGSMTVPKGTTAERPIVPIAGMFRFNTDAS
jgi:hypothetical protein